MSDTVAYEVLGKLITDGLEGGVRSTAVDYDHKALGVNISDLLALIAKIVDKLNAENIAAFVELIKKGRELYDQLFSVKYAATQVGVGIRTLSEDAEALGISLADILKIAELIRQLITLLRR